MNFYSLSNSFYQEKMLEKQKTYLKVFSVEKSGKTADKSNRKKEFLRSSSRQKSFEKNLKFLETLKKELKKWE